tara:strand:- start:10531 stop:11586 length:1056 start_codon:yes stop_codon:yes gene_type:complete
MVIILNDSENKLTKRTRVVRDYPINTLEDALIIPLAIYKNNAGLPIDRKLLSKSLGTTYKSSTYITKINSSFSYGLTMGGYRDDLISLTELGKSIVAPINKDEYRISLLRSLYTPPFFGKIYKILEGKILPGDDHMINLLEREFNMPSQISRECLCIIKSNGLFTDLIKETIDGLFVVYSKDILSQNNVQKIESNYGSIDSNVNQENDTRQILILSDVENSDSLSLICGFLENIDIQYFNLKVVDFRNIAKNGSSNKENLLRKINKCSSAIIYLENAEGGNYSLYINFMLNLGALLYKFDMKVVIILKRPIKLLDDLIDFDPIILNDAPDQAINKLLLNKMVNKSIIKISV